MDESHRGIAVKTEDGIGVKCSTCHQRIEHAQGGMCPFVCNCENYFANGGLPADRLWEVQSQANTPYPCKGAVLDSQLEPPRMALRVVPTTNKSLPWPTRSA
jgi:hypothetical protein